jgi:SPP1 gp7 family putative phage head morphogenesis protein
MSFALRHFVQQVHPRPLSLRARRDRRLNAIKPSAANRIAYYQALDHHILTRLRTAGIDVAHALRNHWPPPAPATDTLRANDETTKKVPRPHEVTRAVAIARHSFPAVGGFAIELATKVVKRNLDTVDDRLSASIERSMPGIDIRRHLMLDGPILTEMHRVQRENVELITSIEPEFFDRLEDSISESWNTGERWEELAPRIREIGGITERRSELIARDQTGSMNAAFNRVRQTSLGIERYEWQTADDGDVRPAHQELEGTIQRWDDPPTDDDGDTGPPGEISINCRCVASPLLDLDDDAPEDVGPDEEETDEDEEVADDDV